MIKNNRYIMLIGGIFLQLCLGIMFVWSVFQGPVASYYTWDASQASMIFTTMLIINVGGVIVGGKLNDKKGPQITLYIGFLIIVVGFFLASLVPQNLPWLIYIFYAGMGGFGIGFAYIGILSAAQKWWPDKKGLASGVMVSSYSLSTTVFSPLVNYMIADEVLGVPMTFRALAFIFLGVVAAFGWFIKNPPAAYTQRFEEEVAFIKAQRNYSTGEMLKTKEFYLVVMGIMFVPPLYFILNPIFKTFGEVRGLSESLAVTAVMITGIASAAGGLSAARLSDKINGKRVLYILYSINFICAGAMIFAQGYAYFFFIVLISLSSGGGMALMPVIASDYFGSESFGSNYGLFMIGLMTSSYGFTAIANAVSNAEGMPTTWTFIIPLAAFVIGLAAAILLKPLKRAEPN